MIELGVSVVACFAAAFANSRFRPGAWYRGLRKPAWTPPDRAFPIVWGVLFLAMTVSLWLVLRETGVALTPATGLFALQLGLNASWSWVFFGLRRPRVALAVLAALWLVLLAAIRVVAGVHVVAAVLLVPYQLWLSLALVLNFELWRRNRAA